MWNFYCSELITHWWFQFLKRIHFLWYFSIVYSAVFSIWRSCLQRRTLNLSYEYFFVTKDSKFVWKCTFPKRIEISQDWDGRLFCILIRPTKPNDIKRGWAKFVRQTSDEIKQKQLCLLSCREIILPYEISTSLWCHNTAPVALLFQIIVQPLISAKILMQWMEFAVQIDIT